MAGVLAGPLGLRGGIDVQHPTNLKKERRGQKGKAIKKKKGRKQKRRRKRTEQDGKMTEEEV